jgi:hypothetical protein
MLGDHVAVTGQAPFEAHGHATARDHATLIGDVLESLIAADAAAKV